MPLIALRKKSLEKVRKHVRLLDSHITIEAESPATDLIRKRKYILRRSERQRINQHNNYTKGARRIQIAYRKPHHHLNDILLREHVSTTGVTDLLEGKLFITVEKYHII